jgi:hypothetical protein
MSICFKSGLHLVPDRLELEGVVNAGNFLAED